MELKTRTIQSLMGGGAAHRESYGRVVVITEWFDSQAVDSLFDAVQSMALAGGKLFPHFLFELIQEFIDKWDSSNQEERSHLLSEVHDLFEKARRAHKSLKIPESAANWSVLATQILLNFQRTIATLVQVFTDYADAPLAYGRPTTVELRLNRDLGGLHDYGSHIHAAKSLRGASKANVDYHDASTPAERAIPYFCYRSSSDELSPKVIANLLGTTSNWVQDANSRILKGMGETLVRLGYDSDEIMGAFR